VSQQRVKTWKAAAFAAVAKVYEFEGLLEQARADAMRLGVSYQYGNPTVENVDALVCPCGAFVPLDYANERVPRIDGVLHCQPCREKAAAAQHDANEEGRTP
jgi:hypothetical protein